MLYHCYRNRCTIVTENDASLLLILMYSILPKMMYFSLPITVPDVFQGEGFPGRPGQDLRLVMFVICLLRYAKQPAKELNPISFGILRMQVLYRLAPAFFLIGILNLASATFMSSSYASALISASLSCSRSRFSSS